MIKATSSTSDDIKQKAKAASEDIGNAARETASHAADAVREEATRRADSAKSGVADNVSDVASALRRAAEEMRDGSPQERTFGQIARSLADASDSIRGKDLGEMANEVSAFAKRNPVLFISGIALAGFAATRFATASARRDVPNRDDFGQGDPSPAQSARSVHSDAHADAISADRNAGVTSTAPNPAGGAS